MADERGSSTGQPVLNGMGRENGEHKCRESARRVRLCGRFGVSGGVRKVAVVVCVMRGGEGVEGAAGDEGAGDGEAKVLDDPTSKLQTPNQKFSQALKLPQWAKECQEKSRPRTRSRKVVSSH